MIALTILLIIIGYITAAIIIGYLIHRVSDKKLSFFTVSGTLLLIPVLISTILYLPNYIRLQLLCKSPERSFITKTANVDGYVMLETSLCHMGWPVLFEPGYQYYECEKARDSLSGPDSNAGIYRYTLGRKGEEECMEFAHFMKDTKDKYKRQIQGSCLISVKVDEIDSRYGRKHQRGFIKNRKHIYGDYEYPTDKDRSIKNLIAFYENSIIDRDNNEIISRVRNYKYWPINMKDDFVGNFECKDYVSLDTVHVLTVDE